MAPAAPREYVPTPEPDPVLTGLTVEDWRNIPALQKRLAQAIRAQLKGKTLEDVRAFHAEPQNRLMLAQWRLLHTEVERGEAARKLLQEKLKNRVANLQPQVEKLRLRLEEDKPEFHPVLRRRLEKTEAELQAAQQEQQGQYSGRLHEVLGQPKNAELFCRLANRLSWMEQVAYSGVCEHPGRLVAVLAAIAERYPTLEEEPMALNIATAVALEWSRCDCASWLPGLEWSRCDRSLNEAVEMAGFYIENDRANRFHAGFRRLPFWQLRLICGFHTDTSFWCSGSDCYSDVHRVENRRWALENVHLPAYRYSEARRQVPYRAISPFGEREVHRYAYYEPYQESFGLGALQMFRDGQSVCTGLSYYAAVAAMANGVPAVPLSEIEAAHEAYCVFYDDAWHLCGSVDWRHSVEYEVWPGASAYAFLHLATELYSRKERKNTALADTCLALGVLTREAELLQLAVKVQPLHYPAWRELSRFPRAPLLQLNQTICKGLAPRYPEVAADILLNEVYKHWMSVPQKQKLPFCTAFWKELRGMGPNRWRIEYFADRQLNMLRGHLRGQGKEKWGGAAAVFFQVIAGEVERHKDYTPILFRWGAGHAGEMEEKAQARLLKTLRSLYEKGGWDDALRDSSLRDALVSAAKAGGISLYQGLAESLKDKYRKPGQKLPDWEPFPGELVSRGGLIRNPINPGKHGDEPLSHWGVLEPVGGDVKVTGEESNMCSLLVMLPKPAELSGVVLVCAGSPDWRQGLSPLELDYSMDGETWQNVGRMPVDPKEQVCRLDLKDRPLRARFIRFRRDGNRQIVAASGIFLYGKTVTP